MAEASFAAYDIFDPAGKGRVNLKPVLSAGYSVTPGSAGDTQFLAIEDGELLIVAFRGTRLEGFKIPLFKSEGFAANWGDVVTDARFRPALVEGDVLVHEGFLRAFRQIENAFSTVVDRALENGKAVWLCGHSLGAALATVAAYKYRDRAQGLYTFGSPRVGNGSFADRLMSDLKNICRFVHHRDIVTTAPPEGVPTTVSAAGLREIFKKLSKGAPIGYTHVGRLRFITGHKTWNIQDGEEALRGILALAEDAFSHAKEVAGILTNGFSPIDPRTWPILADVVSDHAPVYYANKIFNACEEASMR